MLTADDETADALAEFDFVLNDDSGSETDVTVIEVQGDVEMLENVDIAMPEEADYSVTQGTQARLGIFEVFIVLVWNVAQWEVLMLNNIWLF